jgi:hypothetical protein
MGRRISIHDVLEAYAKKDAKLTVRKLDRSTVLVEGDCTALEFFGNLLIACARSNEHSVQLSPTGVGKNRFSKQSKLGLYVHRVPCAHEKHSPKQRKSAAPIQ